ncbi:MAG: hypothetical protein AAF716_20725 [Cyanobacteria bacterium P01_D01_bin.1]
MKKDRYRSRFSVGRIILLVLVVIPGLTGVFVFGYFALQDWDQLLRDYAYFTALIEQASTLEALFVAEAQQNIHRINLMADGIWTLLSAILAAIGLHGICR